MNTSISTIKRSVKFNNRSIKFKNRSVKFKKLFKQHVAAIGAASLLSLAAVPAKAFEFNLGEWDGFVDTTFSASAAMRVEGNDEFGTAPPTGRHYIFKDPGDVYATPLGLLTDIGISKDGFGIFARAAYVYDPTIMGKDCSNCSRPNSHVAMPGTLNPTTFATAVDPAYNLDPIIGGFADPVGTLGVPPSNGFSTVDGIGHKAQKLAGNRFNLLDLFVYGGWDIGSHPLNVRIGKQVINWGESNIQSGGISQMMNPRDLSKATTPGTDVKETLIPQESVYFNFGFTDNISLEAYYTWNWRESTFVGVGTYFSGFDFIGPGYNPDLFVRGIERTHNREPDNGGQWGINMHFIIPQWNYADLGIYWVRSHGFIPHTQLSPDYTTRADPANPNGTTGQTLAGYAWTYGQDQDTYAISLNGEAPYGMSFAIEANVKKQSGDVRECRDLFGIGGVQAPWIPGAAFPWVGAGFTDGAPVAAAFRFATPTTQAALRPETGPGADGPLDCNPQNRPGLRDSAPGASDVYVLLWNLTKSGGTSLFGADKLSMVFDTSFVWVPDCHGGDELDRSNGVGGFSPFPGVNPPGNSDESSVGKAIGKIGDRGTFECNGPLDQPITDFSWGYTAVAALEYNNVFWNLTVKPTFIFIHNVEGWAPPSHGGGMAENQRSAVARLSFDYQGQQSVDLTYVTWLGEAGGSSDKDFVSLTYKYSF